MDAKQIKETFERYGVEVVKDDFWQVQGTWVVKHKALERLSGKLGIQFDDPKMMVQTANELVMFVRGHITRDGKTFSDWSFGEVLTEVPGLNYKTSGKQPSYRWAMVEKRCRDRVILKLAGLHGLYSEDEADEFRDSAPKPEQARTQPEVESEKPAPKRGEIKVTSGLGDKPSNLKPVKLEVVKSDEPVEMPDYAHLGDEGRAICDKVLGITEIDQVSDYMMSPEVQGVLNAGSADDRNFIRQFAARKLKALGWLNPKPGAKRADAGS